jgi:hypothetical protein
VPWLWRFAAISLSAIAAVAVAAVGLVWFLTGESPAELGLHGVIALTLGIALSAALGVGLMALVFFSARGGTDGKAGGGGGDSDGNRA